MVAQYRICFGPEYEVVDDKVKKSESRKLIKTPWEFTAWIPFWLGSFHVEKVWHCPNSMVTHFSPWPFIICISLISWSLSSSAKIWSHLPSLPANIQSSTSDSLHGGTCRILLWWRCYSIQSLHSELSDSDVQMNDSSISRSYSLFFRCWLNIHKHIYDPVTLDNR